MRLKISTIYDDIFLTEARNRLYGKRVIEPAIRRINDNSEATLNMLAISGLFRGKFGDIQQLRTLGQLQTEFKLWYDHVIEGLVSETAVFLENKDLAETYLTAYVENIRTLADNARPFSIKTVERDLVDVVNRHRWVKETEMLGSKTGIYSPDTEDIMFQDNNVVILNSRTKAKCVKYGQGEGWCIGKPELNYYNTYRITYKATPYHVLQKNTQHNDRLHKFVIMNYGPGHYNNQNRYALADRQNSNFHGGETQAVDWDTMEDRIPALAGLEQYFPYREVTTDERNYEEFISERITETDIMRYIRGKVRGMVLNGSPVTPIDFLRDYLAGGKNLYNEQLRSLNEKEMDSIIELGYFLRFKEYSIGELNDLFTVKQVRRIVRLKLNNNLNINIAEFTFLEDMDKKAYIPKFAHGSYTFYNFLGTENTFGFRLNFMKDLLRFKEFHELFDNKILKDVLRWVPVGDETDELLKKIYSIDVIRRQLTSDGVEAILGHYTNGKEFALHLFDTGFIFDNLSYKLLLTLRTHLDNDWLDANILSDERFYRTISGDMLDYALKSSNDQPEIMRNLFRYGENFSNAVVSLILANKPLLDNPDEMYNKIFQKYIGETLDESMPFINTILYESDEEHRIGLIRDLLSNPNNVGDLKLTHVYTFIVLAPNSIKKEVIDTLFSNQTFQRKMLENELQGWTSIFSWWAIDKKNKLNATWTTYLLEKIVHVPDMDWDTSRGWEATFDNGDDMLVYRINSILEEAPNKLKIYRAILSTVINPEAVNDVYQRLGRFAKAVSTNEGQIKKLSLRNLFEDVQ